MSPKTSDFYVFGGSAMIPLVEVPEIVRHYAPDFESLFSPEAFQHFQRYISGLIISENKTVEGINRVFVIETRNQSSLNRFLQGSSSSKDGSCCGLLSIFCLSLVAVCACCWQS